MERRIPTKEEVLSYLKDDRNWGRWGDDDQLGAVNMITADKRIEAAGLVKSGQAISLSRDFPVIPAPNNPTPAHHYMKKVYRSPTAGFSADYYGISYHGTATTHLDALCHVWDENGMWNGRNPDEEITMDGAQWGAVHHWNQGLITRGVLLDVPKHRGTPYVTMETPIHGWELEDIAKEQGVEMRPGDALLVYGGREVYNADGNPLWGSNPPGAPRPAYDLLEVHPRVGHLPAGLGHDGPHPQRLRVELGGARLHLRLRHRPAGQCAAPAPRRGLRR